jgi:hypothetical protein
LYFFISFLLDIDNYILGPSGGRNEALCLKWERYNKALQNAIQYRRDLRLLIVWYDKWDRESEARPACADKAKLEFLEGN